VLGPPLAFQPVGSPPHSVSEETTAVSAKTGRPVFGSHFENHGRGGLPLISARELFTHPLLLPPYSWTHVGLKSWLIARCLDVRE